MSDTSTPEQRREAITDLYGRITAHMVDAYRIQQDLHQLTQTLDRAELHGTRLNFMGFRLFRQVENARDAFMRAANHHEAAVADTCMHLSMSLETLKD